MSETWVPREELEGLIGRDGAALLCREAGGVPIYVPVKTNPACRLGRILPQRQLAALVAAYGGTMIAVPNGKFRPHKDVILKRLAQGEPHARIALDVGVTSLLPSTLLPSGSVRIAFSFSFVSSFPSAPLRLRGRRYSGFR